MATDAFRYWEYLAVFAGAGFLSGFVSGFFGIGGGFVRVPLFLLLFPYFVTHGEYVMHVAAATSLAIGIPSGIMSLRRRMKSGDFDRAYFWKWAVGLAIGSGIGVLAFPYVPGTAMKILFVALLFLFAIYFGLVPEKMVLRSQPPRGLPRILVSGGISSFVVMTGVGGGSACSFAMKVCAVPLQAALAMGTASALVINILGATGCMWNGWGTEGLPKWNLGFVDGMVFLAMLPGVVLASVWGSRASLNLDRKLLKRLYAAFLALIAVFMVYNLAVQ